MSSGHRLGSDLLGAYGADFLTVDDPGDAGTLLIEKSHGVCQLVSAGAETRVLPDETTMPIGVELYLVMTTDGGDIVFTSAGLNQAGNNTLTFNDVGDWALLKVLHDGTDNTWKLIASNGPGVTTV